MRHFYIAVVLFLASCYAQAQSTFLKTIGNQFLEEPNKMIRTRDGGCLTVGYTYASDSTTWDVYAVKMDSNYNVKWMKSIGGTGNDSVYGSGGDYGYAVAQVSDGYIIGGVSYSFGNNDMYIVKLKNNGSLEWSKTIGGAVDDYARAIIETADGGCLLVGSTFSYGTKEDVYVVKLDVNGNLTWVKSFGGNKPDVGNSVIEVNDGYIIAGQTLSFTHGLYDAYILKISKTGSLIWSKNVGGINDDKAMSVRRTYDNNLIVVGSTSSYGNGQGDALILKLDPSGNMLWSKCFGGSYPDFATDIIRTNDGTYAITGDITVEQYRPSKGFILKMTEDANLIWEKTVAYTDISIYSMKSVIQSKDSGFVFTGEGFSSGSQGADGNFCFIKCDKNGNMCFPTTTDGFMTSINPAIASAATNTINEKDKLFTRTSIQTSGGIINQRCASLNQQSAKSLVASSNAQQNKKVSVYPNPVTDNLNIVYTSTSASIATLRILDDYKRVVLQKPVSFVAGKNQRNFYLKSLPAGAYILQILTPNETTNINVIKIK